MKVTFDEPGVAVRMSGAVCRASRSFAVTVTHDFPVGVTVLRGPNGSGKTTVLKCLATATPPAGGEVRLGDLRYEAPNYPVIRSRLGYVPQHFQLMRLERVEDYLRYTAWLHGLAGDVAAERVAEALCRVGLTDRARLRFGRLSGGMQRRLAIAQALIPRPRLLLMDEPTTGLDTESTPRFTTLLTDLAKTTCTIVASHAGDHVLDPAWVVYEMPVPPA